MASITIFYEKKTKNLTINKSVTFDPIFGDQTRLQRFKFGVERDGKILEGHQALQAIDGVGPLHIPALPVLPEKYLIIGKTVWKTYPENKPEFYEGTYKARDAVNRNKIIFLEYRKESDIVAWETFKVYDFCKDFEKDSFTKIPNPEYDLVMGERALLKMAFIDELQIRGIGGLKIIPLGLAKYGNIPDSEGYRWYLVEGSTKVEIPVIKGAYPNFKFLKIQNPELYSQRFLTLLPLLDKQPSTFDFFKQIFQV